MKILISGGTGFVGRALVGQAFAAGHSVTVASRRPADVHMAFAQLKIVANYPDLSGFDAVVQLSGENLFAKRWNDAQKEVIRKSRIESARAIVDALAKAEKKPRAYVQASAIGFYGSDRGEELLDESAAPGDDFLAGVCREWESTAAKARELGVATTCLRTGIVLGKGGGALAQMIPPFKLGLGGPIGAGRQWMSWVHIQDLARLIVFALEKELDGPLNGVAPEPARNKDFTKALGKVLHRPTIFPIPPFGLKLRFGEVADVLTGSLRCSAERALASGFQFKHPTLEKTLADVLHHEH